MGKHTTFILTDSEVKKEEFLEYINMILSTGEIAGLLSKAAAGILKWAAAIYEYHEKTKIVKPKRIYLQI